MLIKTKITYEEGYLPTPRCRKLRYRECEEVVEAELEEVNFSDLKLAFEDCSYKGKGKIFYYNGKLWCKEKAPNEWEQKQFGYKTALDKCIDLLEHNCYYLSLRSCGKDNSRESVLSELLSDMAEHILVDGELYSMTSEPRYCIQTFGLGHNHGGTSLFCDYYYN